MSPLSLLYTTTSPISKYFSCAIVISPLINFRHAFQITQHTLFVSKLNPVLSLFINERFIHVLNQFRTTFFSIYPFILSFSFSILTCRDFDGFHTTTK
eukprot:UN03267